MPERAYFGHPVTTYNSRVEDRALQAIRQAYPGVEILNPNAPEHDAAYRLLGMSHFVQLVDACDFGVFMPFSDGAWGAGIFKEAKRLTETGKPVYELRWGPQGPEIAPLQMHEIDHLLSIEQTRARIAAGLR